jgi:hypothetical protein
MCFVRTLVNSLSLPFGLSFPVGRMMRPFLMVQERGIVLQEFFFFHMLWLVLGLVLVCFCGMWPQKLGTREPCPQKIRGSSDKNGTRNPTKNEIESFRTKISSATSAGVAGDACAGSLPAACAEQTAHK